MTMPAFIATWSHSKSRGRVKIAALTTILTLGASSPAMTQGEPEPDTGPIAAEWLYNGVKRPVMIAVDPGVAAADATVHLVVLANDGSVLIGPKQVRPGRLDLAEAMPDIWTLPEAAYLQCLVNDKPVGAALVLQPMLSRMVPVTEQATRPGTDARYTKVIGWRSAAAPDRDPATAEVEDEVLQRRILSGLRIYQDHDILIETSLGNMRFAMRPDAAPNTAWNFRELCEGGFYRDVAFHRVVPLDRQGNPFVIQAGDPSGSGEGGPGYWLPIEPSTLPHDFGVLSMARSDDPDSAGSQFFVCLSREGTARLDMQYCAFGELVDCEDVVRAIAAVELADASRGRPAKPPVILATKLLPASPRGAGIGRLDMHVAPEAEPAEPVKPARVDR